MRFPLVLVLLIVSFAAHATDNECIQLGKFAESAQILAQQTASESVYHHEIGKRIAATDFSPRIHGQNIKEILHAIASDAWNSRKTTRPSQTRLMVTLMCEHASEDIQVLNARLAATCGVVAMIGATAIPDKTSISYKNLKMASDKNFAYAEGVIGETETYRIAAQVKDEIFEALNRGDMTVERDYRQLCIGNT